MKNDLFLWSILLSLSTNYLYCGQTPSHPRIIKDPTDLLCEEAQQLLRATHLRQKQNVKQCRVKRSSPDKNNKQHHLEKYSDSSSDNFCQEKTVVVHRSSTQSSSSLHELEATTTAQERLESSTSEQPKRQRTDQLLISNTAPENTLEEGEPMEISPTSRDAEPFPIEE